MEKDLEKMMVGKPFLSKKNSVFSIRTDDGIRVAKVFSEEFKGRAQNEFDTLRLCRSKGIRVPEPIELRKDAIIMSYVPGENVGDIFGGNDRASAIESIHLVADWLAGFHRAFGMKRIRGDAILRNFILHEGSIFGLDFEESAESSALDDVGQTCAYILSTRPKFTDEKFVIASDFIGKYLNASGQNHSSEISDSVAKGLRHYAEYRKDKALLEKWAKKVESSGIL